MNPGREATLFRGTVDRPSAYADLDWDVVLNDSELVAGLRRKDSAAVRHLCECLLPSIWRLVYFRVKRDRHLAEDIVSDTVLALIKAVALPNADVTNPGAWLRSVAAHKIQDHFRAVTRVQHLIEQVAPTFDQKDSSQSTTQQEVDERRATVRKVLESMREMHRLALEWKYLDHISVREIADRMGITEKAAEALLYRARTEFREALGMLDREDFPFRVNATTGVTSGKQDAGDPSLAPARVNGDPSTKNESQQPASFDGQKQQS